MGAVLFDIDGTLVDSNYVHVTAWLEAFQAVGRAVPASSIHRCIGMDSSALLERLLGDDAEVVGGKAKHEHSLHYRRAAGVLVAFERATDLVRTVTAKATTVLATSAPEDELEILHDILGLGEAVAVVTSAKDVRQAKPQPDIVEVALRKAGVAAGDAVFVGDTVWDVAAATHAGVPCVCVLTGGISAGELRDAGAVAVYDDPAALLDGLDDSPLASVFT